MELLRRRVLRDGHPLTRELDPPWIWRDGGRIKGERMGSLFAAVL